MKHIFIQHSNITIISTFDTVRQALNNGEEVIIILGRKIPYDFFKDRVKVYDFIDIFKEDREKAKGYNGFTIRKFLAFIGHHKRYLKHMEETISNIVGDEDFILYTANNNQPVSGVCLSHKRCAGYYYIEDGTMNYTPLEQITKVTCSPRKRGRRFLYSLFGVKSYYHLEITEKFMGTIGISPEAFKWNKKKRIVTDLSSYKDIIKNRINAYDIIVVTSNSGSDAQALKKGLDIVFKHISERYPHSSVGVKMHPHDFSFEKDKVNDVYHYLEKKYVDFSAKGLDVDYSIEAAIFLYHPIVYSVYIPSSLSVYSILFSGSSYLLLQNEDNNSIVEYTSYQKMIADYYNTH